MKVDNEFKILLKSSWLTSCGYVRFYKNKNEQSVNLARYIYEQKLGRKLKWSEEIDHINLIKSDNRLSNLRLVTRSQNNMNRVFKSKGVRLTKEKHWQARIIVNKKHICLGTFKTKCVAIAAYNKASEKFHGSYGRASI